MRWFKHFTDNHRGQTVQTLWNELGLAGVGAYFIIMELCAEKMESGSDFVFTFKRPYFDNVLRMKRKSTENVLRILSESNVLTSTLDDNEIKIEFPILLNLLDRDMKKPRLNRVSSAQSRRLDKELDKELDLDKERRRKRTPKKKASPQPTVDPIGKILTARYCELWKSRYGSNPTILPQHPKQLKTIGEQNGKARTLQLLDAYFECPESWFVKKRHDISTFSSNLSNITAFLNSGKTISNNELRQFDNAISTKNTLDLLRDGKI